MPPEFFIVGAPRSGTTLLRTMVTGHPLLSVPAETNFLPRLIQAQPLWWRRGHLDTALFARLASANGRLALRGIERRDVEQVLRAQPVMTPREGVGRLYALLGDPGTMVGDKSPSYALATASLDQFFGGAVRYIHLVRHPMAVTASLMNQPWAPSAPDLAALIWLRYVGALERLTGDPRCLCIRLEDLVVDPERVLTHITDLLTVPFHPEMLDFAARAQDSQDSNFYPQSHTGLSGALRTTRDWSEQLSAAEQRRAWGVVAPMAHRWGYAVDGIQPDYSPWPRLRMAGFDVKEQWRRGRTVWNLLSGRR